MNKKSFILYTDYLQQINSLSDEQAGKLFKAILIYEDSQEEIITDGIVKMAFSFIKSDLDRNRDKYESVVNKRVEAGRKGGLAKSSNAKQNVAKVSKSKQTLPNVANASFGKQTLAKPSKGKQSIANVADNDNDNVNDNDNDNENENVINTKSKFIPPTVEEVEEYCFYRNNGIDAEAFIDYYRQRNWKISNGKQPMLDWKAAVRTWERNNYSNNCKSVTEKTEEKPVKKLTYEEQRIKELLQNEIFTGFSEETLIGKYNDPLKKIQRLEEIIEAVGRNAVLMPDGGLDYGNVVTDWEAIFNGQENF